MPTNEAQVDEGQVQTAEVDADITGMTVDDISKRIDDDAAFAKAYTAGRIVDKGAKPAGEADAGVEPAQTPANPKAEPSEKTEKPTEKPGEQVFTIKSGDLPEGFDTPGKVFKSLAEKQTYIEQVQGQVRQRDQRIHDLEAQIAREADAKKLAEDKRAVADVEVTDQNLYDPEYMKTQLRRLQKMDKLEQELNELKTQVNLNQQQDEQKKQISQELDVLRNFQSKYPALKTSKAFDEIDAEYAKFVDGIAGITGAPTMQDALKFVNVFIQDKGEDGNNLRAAAAKAEIKAPTELAAYLRVMAIRQTAQDVVKIDPATKKPRQLTLEEAFKLTYPDLYVQGGKPAPAIPPKPLTPQEEKVQERERQRQEAAKLDDAAAVEIAPADSKTGESVDDLSDQQIDELFKMTPAQLRQQPGKKKLLDEVYIRLNMPVLNVNGQKDALA